MMRRFKLLFKSDTQETDEEREERENGYGIGHFEGVDFRNEVLVIDDYALIKDCTFRNCVLIFKHTGNPIFKRVSITSSVVSGEISRATWDDVFFGGIILNDLRTKNLTWSRIYFTGVQGHLTISGADLTHVTFRASPDLEIVAKQLSRNYGPSKSLKPVRESSLKELTVEDITYEVKDLIAISKEVLLGKKQELLPLGGRRYRETLRK